MRAKLRKILVTGGAGFIGSVFVRRALEKGYRVIVVDKLTYAGDLKRLKGVRRKSKLYKTDICDKKKINDIFARERPDALINFAAETHVDRSIRDATSFIDTNIKGLRVLLDAARELHTRRFIQISCYDEKTKAFTTDGLKTFNEIKKGDHVYSLNPITKEIEIKPVKEVIIQPYAGKMFHFNNKRIDLMVTPEHNMLILNTKKKLGFETAQRVSQRSIFYMPEGYWKGKKEEYFNIEGYGRVKTADLMYILGIFIGDGFIAYQEKEAITKTGLNRKAYLQKARDKESGRFQVLAREKIYKTVMHGYRIFLDIPENDKSRKKVEKVLSNLDIKYHFHKGKAGTHIYFTSKVFMEFFKQCGQGSHNKRIPRWALEYGPDQLRHLFQGLMDSDGRNDDIYYTVSEKLASDICELCFKLGFKPSIYKRHCESFINDRKIVGDSYYICISTTTKSISRHRNKIIDYKGKVWCLRVEDNRNFIVERNGKFDFCGNSDEVYGEIRKGDACENSAFNPSSPYAASKAAADLLAKSYMRTFDFPAIIIRPSNNYGPWQYPEKLIPLAVLKILRNETVPVYGNGRNIRTWLYVDDCVEGILQILEKGRIGEVYNLGSNEELQNLDVVKFILKILGASTDRIEFVKDRPGHDLRYRLNSQKIFKETGWKQKIKFQHGIRLTVEWCLAHRLWLLSKWKEIDKLYQ